jgi:CCR4-NOT transcription complex subunit 1
VSVTVTLIKHHIIPLAEYEAQLAKFILREFRPTTLDFASRFAKAALEEQPPLATREQFGRVIDALLQAVRSDKATETATRFLEDLRYGQGGLAANRAEAEAQEIKEQLAVFFVQWVRIYQQSASLEKSFVEYVVQLQDHGILKGEDLSSRFFRSMFWRCPSVLI